MFTQIQMDVIADNASRGYSTPVTVWVDGSVTVRMVWADDADFSLAHAVECPLVLASYVISEG